MQNEINRIEADTDVLLLDRWTLSALVYSRFRLDALLHQVNTPSMVELRNDLLIANERRPDLTIL